MSAQRRWRPTVAQLSTILVPWHLVSFIKLVLGLNALSCSLENLVIWQRAAFVFSKGCRSVIQHQWAFRQRRGPSIIPTNLPSDSIFTRVTSASCSFLSAMLTQ